MEDEAEHQEQQHPADSDVGRSEAHAGKTAASAPATAIAAIFDVVADPARFPVHVRDGAILGPSSHAAAGVVSTMLSTVPGHY